MNQENPYGYCPICLSPGIMRERRLNGDDKCMNGHTYPSANAKKTPGIIDPPPTTISKPILEKTGE